MVARIDGRSCTKLTKEKHDFEALFDIKFRDMIVDTTKHLMNCGFNVVYGYTQSDEISLLFALEETLFGRKLRKYNSVLAGEASAEFSLLLGDIGVFDCRISQLPTKELVTAYFCWRNEDAHRNALNAHCYWLMRKQGENATTATAFLSGKTIAEKNEFLFQNGINFNDIPNWQKRGTGLYWENYEKLGENPITKEKITTVRRQVKIDYDLPMKNEYESFLAYLIP